jgi:hypothetical protein
MKTLEETRRERDKKWEVSSCMQHSRLKQSAILSGVIALAVGLYFLTILDYHEGADLGAGVGTVCLLVASSGRSWPDHPPW